MQNIIFFSLFFSYKNICFFLLHVQVVVFELFQWILSFLPISAVQGGMKMLIGTGNFLPDGVRRVDHTWRTLVVPHYAGPHSQVEVAVAYEDCSTAMSELVQLIQEKSIPVNHIVEVSNEQI